MDKGLIDPYGPSQTEKATVWNPVASVRARLDR